MRQALSRAGLSLSPANISIEPAPGALLQVSLTRGGKSTTLIDRKGAGFYGPGTPAEIAEVIRRAL